MVKCEDGYRFTPTAFNDLTIGAYRVDVNEQQKQLPFEFAQQLETSSMNQHSTDDAEAIQSSTGALRFDVIAGLTAAGGGSANGNGNGICDWSWIARCSMALYRLYSDGCLRPAWLIESTQRQLNQYTGHPGWYANRSGRPPWPRAHVVQRACGDRALSGAGGGRLYCSVFRALIRSQ